MDTTKSESIRAKAGLIGEILSHYRIIEKLGQGGMGVVYHAEDLRLGRSVALKILAPELVAEEKARQRFLQEARAAAMLDHPNICTIYEAEQVSEDFFVISMAYYSGQTLKNRIACGRLPAEEALDLAIQAARGLAKAHAHGVLHRDIKPSNLLITEDRRLKIVDFGLAKLTTEAKLTTTGRAMGTVAYMSPEQGRGEQVGPEADVWSLGVVLYEMLSGELPFKGSFEVAVLQSILKDKPVTLGRLVDGVPLDLERIVERALEKQARKRYADASEMLADLENLSKKVNSGKTWSQPSPRRLDYRRSRFLGYLLSAVAGATLVASVWWLLPQEESSRFPLTQPRLVRSGDGWQDDPALSPDGTRIAFASSREGNRDIYLIGVRGGNPVRLTHDPADEYRPTWFPDGTAIAFVSRKGGTSGIWKMDQMGGGAILLVGEGASDPAISPDGSRIAFSIPGPSGDNRIGLASLHDPAGITLLTGEEDGLWSHRSPSWSPDGRSLCYQDQQDLWLVSAAGGPAQRLTREGKRDRRPVWSGDGKYILFSSWRDDTLALWRVPAGGGAAERLTLGSGYEQAPSLCRDGSRLAFATQMIHRELLLRDMDSGKEVKLQSGIKTDLEVAISPQGDRLVDASLHGGNSVNLWMQALEGDRPIGSPVRLTDDPGSASHPVFSPDGQWIAYYRINDRQRDIYVISASGGRPQRITDDPAADIHPSWSPDGAKLAYSSERGGSSRIWVIPVREGRPAGEPVCLTDGKWTARLPVWSPDGKKIAYLGSRGSQCEVWIMPQGGGPDGRQITNGAEAQHLRWDADTNSILVSGNWGGSNFVLKRVSPDGRNVALLVPEVNFGPLFFSATFDLTQKGKKLLYFSGDIQGAIWILELQNLTR